MLTQRTKVYKNEIIGLYLGALVHKWVSVKRSAVIFVE